MQLASLLKWRQLPCAPPLAPLPLLPSAENEEPFKMPSILQVFPSAAQFLLRLELLPPFPLPTCHMLHAACPIAAPSIIVYFGWRQRRRSCWGKWTAIYKNALSCSADNKYEFESAAAALRHAACGMQQHVARSISRPA